jgi:hypothetical protein
VHELRGHEGVRTFKSLSARRRSASMISASAPPLCRHHRTSSKQWEDCRSVTGARLQCDTYPLLGAPLALELDAFPWPPPATSSSAKALGTATLLFPPSVEPTTPRAQWVD